MTKDGIRTIDIVERTDNKIQAFCIFEYVYFARSDSIFEGKFQNMFINKNLVFLMANILLLTTFFAQLLLLLKNNNI